MTGVKKPDFEIYADGLNERRRQQDSDDLNNERASRSTGRMQRFFIADTSPAAQEEKKRKEEFETALAAMLADAAYAKLYYESGTILQSAAKATDDAIQKAEIDLKTARDTLQQTLKNADKLPDGTAVFKDAEGKAWTQDGRRLNDEERESVVWKQGPTVSYEEYLRQKKYEDDLRLWLEKLHINEAKLGAWHVRWSDEKKPITQDEMKQMREDCKRMQSDIDALDTLKIRNQPVSKLHDVPTHQGDLTAIIAKPVL